MRSESVVRLELEDMIKKFMTVMTVDERMAKRRVSLKQDQHDRFYQLRDDKGRNILMAIIE